MKEPYSVDPSDIWQLFISTGDETYFSAIYFEFYDMLFTVGLRYTSDVQIIEDSIQNIFIYLLKNRTKIKKVTKVQGYLIKSFRHQLFLDLKKQKKLSFLENLPENKFEYFNSIEYSISKQEETDEILSALRKSIKNLSAKQQEIIYLRFDCDLSYEEISTILEISVDSCYKSVYRAIKIVKSDIEIYLKNGCKLLLLSIILSSRKSLENLLSQIKDSKLTE